MKRDKMRGELRRLRRENERLRNVNSNLWEENKRMLEVNNRLHQENLFLRMKENFPATGGSVTVETKIKYCLFPIEEGKE